MAPGLAERVASILQAVMSAVALGNQLLRRVSCYLTSWHGICGAGGLMQTNTGPIRWQSPAQGFLPARLSFPWRHRALWGCAGVEVVSGFIFVRLLARAAVSLWCPVLLTLPCASWQQGMNQIGSTMAWTTPWLASLGRWLW